MPLDPVDVRHRAGFRITSPHRTLFDLARVVSVDRLEAALDDALRRGLTSVGQLEETVRRLASQGRKGSGAFRKLVAERASRHVLPESTLESRLLRALAEAWLPAPTCQFEVHTGSGLVARVDFAYPECRLAIEADGYRYHSGRPEWQRDLRCQNSLLSEGWRVLGNTWRDVIERPDFVAGETRRQRELLQTEPAGALPPCATSPPAARRRAGRAGG
jgi:very-short-patch-repair endonuclease